MFSDLDKPLSVLGATVLMHVASPANASNWGCEVLLCLSNPAGPKAVAECVDPINRLWKALKKFPPDPFPRCDLVSATGSHSGTYANRARNYYDPCPAGTSALQRGARAVPIGQRVTLQTVVTGIGDGVAASNYQPDSEGDQEPLRDKVCVGRRAGDAVLTVDSGEGTEQFAVDVYDPVVLMQPAASPRVVNVYIDNRLARVVRY